MLFGEAKGPSIIAQLRDNRLLAPAIPAFEIHDICAMKCRKPPQERAELLAGLPRFQVKECRVEHGEVLTLANTTRLTHYDASYLWLITLDRTLARAASA